MMRGVRRCGKSTVQGTQQRTKTSLTQPSPTGTRTRFPKEAQRGAKRPVVGRKILDLSDPSASRRLPGQNTPIESLCSRCAGASPSAHHTTQKSKIRSSKGPALSLLLLVLLVIACRRAAAASISAAELPRRPEAACNTPAVFRVVARCDTTPERTCCDALDAVWADRNSPSFGCLCFPPVLCQAVLRAAEAKLNLLAVLNSCRQRYNFSTQWTGASNRTGCPPMPFDVLIVALAPLIGPAPLLKQGAAGSARWSWANLLQMAEAASQHDYGLGRVIGYTPYIDVLLQDIYSINLVKVLLGWLMVVCGLFLTVSCGLQRCSGVYRGSLSQQQRLVTAQHAVYVLVFGVCLGPQAWLTLSVLFGPLTGTTVASKQLTWLVGLLVVHLSLFLLEAGYRVAVKPNRMLIAHSILFTAEAFVAVLSRNPALLIMTLLMDLGCVFEVPLYATLVAWRLQLPARSTRALLRASLAWYVLTRLFQLVALMYMVVGFAALPSFGRTPGFFIQSVTYLMLCVGSVLTLLAYRNIDARLAKLQALQEATGAPPDRRHGRSGAGFCSGLCGFVPWRRDGAAAAPTPKERCATCTVRGRRRCVGAADDLFVDASSVQSSESSADS